MRQKSGFTLVELLMVVAVLAILAIVTVLFLNPTQFIAQGRDTRRISDLKDIDTAISLAKNSLYETLTDNTQPNLVYISLPDKNGTLTDDCGTNGEYTLPTLLNGWQYRCRAAEANLRKVDNTGWIPIDFTSVSTNILSVMPIDPVNNQNNYYTYSWDASNASTVTAKLESGKYLASHANNTQGDGGNDDLAFETRPISWGTVGDGDVWVSKISAVGPLVKLRYDGSIVGSYPGITNGGGIGLAIDDSGYVWAVDYVGGTIVKVNRGDGSIVGTYPVGAFPYGVAVDVSGNIWVTGGKNPGGYVAKINGSTGALIGTYGAGLNWPIGVTVDTSGNIWVASQGSRTVTKFNSSTGAVIGTYCSPTDCGYLYGVAADASGNIWVAGLADGGNGGTVTKLNGSTGAFVAKYTMPPGNPGDSSVMGIAADASGNVWATSYGGYATYKIRISDGNVSGPYQTGMSSCQYGFGGTAVGFDGNVWITSYCGYVIKINGSTGAVIGSYSIGLAPNTIGDFTGFAYQYFVLGRR